MRHSFVFTRDGRCEFYANGSYTGSAVVIACDPAENGGRWVNIVRAEPLLLERICVKRRQNGAVLRCWRAARKRPDFAMLQRLWRESRAEKT